MRNIRVRVRVRKIRVSKEATIDCKVQSCERIGPHSLYLNTSYSFDVWSHCMNRGLSIPALQTAGNASVAEGWECQRCRGLSMRALQRAGHASIACS